MTHLINTSSFKTAVCTTIYTTNRRINIMQPSQKRKGWFAILGRLTIFSVGIQYHFLGWRHIRKRSYFKINIIIVLFICCEPHWRRLLCGEMTIHPVPLLPGHCVPVGLPPLAPLRPSRFHRRCRFWCATYPSPSQNCLSLPYVEDILWRLWAIQLVNTMLLEEAEENKKKSLLFSNLKNLIKIDHRLWKKQHIEHPRMQAMLQRNAMALRPALIL